MENLLDKLKKKEYAEPQREKMWISPLIFTHIAHVFLILFR